MALSTLRRRNFYRMSTLIVDNGSEALRSLLDSFIKKRYRQTFKDFITENQHDIYHYFRSNRCCQCSRRNPIYRGEALNTCQMEVLFDRFAAVLPGHKAGKEDFCCCPVRQTLQLKDVDITLLRFFLINYFEDDFWQYWLSGHDTLQQILNANKHDLYHTYNSDTACCLCPHNHKIPSLLGSNKLNVRQWEAMFRTPDLPCTAHMINDAQEQTLLPCSRSATTGIQYTDLQPKSRLIILSKFCPLMKHLNCLFNSRNKVYAHAIIGEISDEEFRTLWNETESSIVELSKASKTDTDQTTKILELRERALEETSCLELHRLILTQIQRENNLLQAVQGVDVKLFRKLVSIENELKRFNTLPQLMRSEMSGQLAEYSDITRNIIENTRKEIEFYKNQKPALNVRAAVRLLERNDILIIVGCAGSGKSKTALAISSIMQDKGYIILKLEPNLATEIKTLLLRGNKQLIIFEDLFGKSDVRYDEDMHTTLLDVLEPHVTNNTSKFIITVRSHKLDITENFMTQHSFLSKARVLDLDQVESESVGIISQEVTELHQTCRKTIATFSSSAQVETDDRGYHDSLNFIIGKLIAKVKENPTGVQSFLIEYGTKHLVSCFNQELVKVISISESITKCQGKFLEIFVRPSTFQIRKDSIGVNCRDRWIAERLVSAIQKEDIELVLSYTKNYCRNERFIKKFNGELHKWMEIQGNVESCSWNIFETFVRPSTYKIAKEEIGSCANDEWVKQRLMKTLFKTNNGIPKLHSYSKNYGSEEFITAFNEDLQDWLSVEENLTSCNWDLFKTFVRPSTFRVGRCLVVACIDDHLIIKTLLNELRKPTGQMGLVKSYTEDYGTEKFASLFNEELSKWLGEESVSQKCDWAIFRSFVRPSSFIVSPNKLGACIDDCLIISRLRKVLLETEKGLIDVRSYLNNYRTDQFMRKFNEELKRCIAVEQVIKTIRWDLFEYCIRPSTFSVHEIEVGAATNDQWVARRLVEELSNGIIGVQRVNSYTNSYGSTHFVNMFNRELKEFFGVENNVMKSNWCVLETLVRPSSSYISKGEVGVCVNDQLLVRRFMADIEKEKKKAHHVKDYVRNVGSRRLIECLNSEVFRKSGGRHQNIEDVIDSDKCVIL